MSDLMEKYRQDMTILHDKEILDKFFDQMIISLLNIHPYEFPNIEKNNFINCFIENLYLNKNVKESNET